jgi:hypothetical protein
VGEDTAAIRFTCTVRSNQHARQLHTVPTVYCLTTSPTHLGLPLSLSLLRPVCRPYPTVNLSTTPLYLRQR